MLFHRVIAASARYEAPPRRDIAPLFSATDEEHTPAEMFPPERSFIPDKVMARCRQPHER
jgi:hypothetical protein